MAEPKAWITVNGKHIPIFEDVSISDDQDKKEKQIAENEQEGSAMNESFNDGDTPRKLDKKGHYTIKKIALDDSKDSDYGQMIGEDAQAVLKGYHYDAEYEMWFKSGVPNHGLEVKRVK